MPSSKGTRHYEAVSRVEISINGRYGIYQCGDKSCNPNGVYGPQISGVTLSERRARDGKELRRGFSSGSCLTAAALGAWRALVGEGSGPESVELLMPDGGGCVIPLRAAFRVAGCGVGVVRKEAGDDPDVTDQALFKVSLCESSQSAGFFDLQLTCGRARLILSGAMGLGLVTRPGLDAEIGRWAINPVPQRMLVENLERAGCGARKGVWRLEIAIPDGQRLAAKTLNPVLGVVDGISVLGTSGYVEPYSHQAYIDTIRILLKGARRAGCREVALCTGGRTAKAVARDRPGLPEYAIVRIADFIAASLKLAAEFGFEQVVVACMVGKLYKYAAGITYTHAHTRRSDCGLLAGLAARLGIAEEKVFALRGAGSVREAFAILTPREQRRIEDELGRRAFAELRQWLGRARLELRLYSPRGESLGVWKSET